MKVAILLAKNILAPLGITAAVSALLLQQLMQEFKNKQKNTWFWNNNFNNFK